MSKKEPAKTKVTLHVYNYGITKVADFGRNHFDAHKCMKMFNDELVRTHNFLPPNIFYFLTYMKQGVTCFFVDFTTTNHNAWLQVTRERIETAKNRISNSLNLQS